jgi:hypothetical protein
MITDEEYARANPLRTAALDEAFFSPSDPCIISDAKRVPAPVAPVPVVAIAGDCRVVRCDRAVRTDGGTFERIAGHERLRTDTRA